MTERCHCTHEFQKRACQHSGFCEHVQTLERRIDQLNKIAEEERQDRVRDLGKVEEIKKAIIDMRKKL